MFFRLNFSGVTPPITCGDETNAKRHQSVEQFATGRISSRAEYMCYYLFSFCIKRIPKPMTLLFVTDKRPLCISFTDKSHIVTVSLYQKKSCSCISLYIMLNPVLPCLILSTDKVSLINDIKAHCE